MGYPVVVTGVPTGYSTCMLAYGDYYGQVEAQEQFKTYEVGGVCTMDVPTSFHGFVAVHKNDGEMQRETPIWPGGTPDVMEIGSTLVAHSAPVTVTAPTSIAFSSLTDVGSVRPLWMDATHDPVDASVINFVFHEDISDVVPHAKVMGAGLTEEDGGGSPGNSFLTLWMKVDGIYNPPFLTQPNGIAHVFNPFDAWDYGWTSSGPPNYNAEPPSFMTSYFYLANDVQVNSYLFMHGGASLLGDAPYTGGWFGNCRWTVPEPVVLKGGRLWQMKWRVTKRSIPEVTDPGGIAPLNVELVYLFSQDPTTASALLGVEAVPVGASGLIPSIGDSLSDGPSASLAQITVTYPITGHASLGSLYPTVADSLSRGWHQTISTIERPSVADAISSPLVPAILSGTSFITYPMTGHVVIRDDIGLYNGFQVTGIMYGSTTVTDWIQG